MTEEAENLMNKWGDILDYVTSLSMRLEFTSELRAVIAAERADAAHAAVMAEREMRREVEDA